MENSGVSMAVKKTVVVSTENLVRIGAERLAAILMEVAGVEAGVRRHSQGWSKDEHWSKLSKRTAFRPRRT